MTKLFSLLLLFVCANVGAYVLAVSEIFASNPFAMDYANPASVLAIFGDWQNLLVSLGIGGGVAGIVGIFTRSFTYTTGVLAIWCVVVLVTPISWFFTGASTVMLAMGVPWAIAYAFQAVLAFILFMSVIDLIAQKPIT